MKLVITFFLSTTLYIKDIAGSIKQQFKYDHKTYLAMPTAKDALEYYINPEKFMQTRTELFNTDQKPYNDLRYKPTQGFKKVCNLFIARSRHISLKKFSTEDLEKVKDIRTMKIFVNLSETHRFRLDIHRIDLMDRYIYAVTRSEIDQHALKPWFNLHEDESTYEFYEKVVYAYVTKYFPLLREDLTVDHVFEKPDGFDPKKNAEITKKATEKDYYNYKRSATIYICRSFEKVRNKLDDTLDRAKYRSCKRLLTVFYEFDDNLVHYEFMKIGLEVIKYFNEIYANYPEIFTPTLEPVEVDKIKDIESSINESESRNESITTMPKDTTVRISTHNANKKY